MYSRQTFNFLSALGSRAQGFTLIELMIVISIIAIIMALALPVYSNYVVRAKIGEGLSLANSAKTAVTAACLENPSMVAINNQIVGYGFTEITSVNDVYVENIQAGGPCTDPVITITTKGIGQTPDPIILLTGQLREGSGQFTWQCSSDNTPNWLLPNTCRS